jgi:hypothetical protein
VTSPFFCTTAALGGALTCTALAGIAGATTPLTKGGCEAEPGERLHDGFFARSESGIALLSAYVSDSGGPPFRSRVRGVGQGASISIGGTPARGLVLGGTLWTARMDPVFVEDGQDVTPDDDSVKVTLVSIGPFVDWYPHPGRGFHALASLALTVQFETDAKGNPLLPAGFGASLSTGAGHEWFLSSQLSLGILSRVALGRLHRAAADGPERTLFIIPELALSATYH